MGGGLAERVLVSGRQDFGWLRKAVRASHECPHLKIEIWGTQIQMWATRQGVWRKRVIEGGFLVVNLWWDCGGLVVN
jgi:hypothetical protein